jgi:hypothetical protein
MMPLTRINTPSHLIALATVLTLVSHGPLGAQTRNEPSHVPPSAPRRLTQEEAARIAELNQQIIRLQDAGRFAEAMTPAREMLELRTKLQGAGHWETVGARRRSVLLKQLASLPEEGQRAIGLTYSKERQAIALERQAAYREAEKTHRAVIETFRHWLGEDHPDTARAYNNLAVNLMHQGRYADAYPLL